MNEPLDDKKADKKTEKPHYLNHRKRLKERFVKAPDAVPDVEVVELLLGYIIKGKDVKPQAKQMLAKCKNIASIFSTSFDDVDGIGPETELFFKVAQEFFVRCNFQAAAKDVLTLDKSSLVFDFLKLKIGHSKRESFILLFLDSKNKLLSYKVVREGFVNTVSMAARDIIEESIKHNAVNIIIGHNHPSGDPSPSNADNKVTRQICHALRYTGITVIDHLIVAKDDFYSYRGAGLIDKFIKEFSID